MHGSNGIHANGESIEGKTARDKRFMPFGDGFRDCLGQEFVKQLTMPILIATLLMKYTFSLAPEVSRFLKRD